VITDIYLDTMLWNALFDNGVDPRSFVRALAQKNGRPVLGLHTFYEFAKTFQSKKKNGLGRAKDLFSYFKLCVEAGVPVGKDNMELLTAEMWALKLRASKPDPLLSEQDHKLVIQEAAKLSNGELSHRTIEFLDVQRKFALATRVNQLQHFELRDDMKQYLRTILPDRLRDWLDSETSSLSGIRILTEHILRRFPDVPRVEGFEYASALIPSASMFFCKGVVRSDLFYNWRCANRGSIPKDLIDDMYHVLNSVYCGVYATSERGQSEYASLLRPAGSRVKFYSGDIPVASWIEGLL
jgi:hypothetical protein